MMRNIFFRIGVKVGFLRKMQSTILIFFLAVASGDSEHTQASEEVDPSPPSPLILGKFHMTSDPMSEDYHNYLKAMEFDEKFVDKFQNTKLLIEFSKTGIKYTQRFHVGPAHFITVFENDKDYDQIMVDGRVCRVSPHIEGNTMMAKELCEKCEHENTILYEFSPAGAKITRSINGISVVHDYAREEIS